MQKFYGTKKRQLLIVAFGISFLILITLVGTSLEALIPHRPTAPIQVAQAGPYQVTLQVNPNPPLITGPANISLQIVHKDTQQLVSNAHITVLNAMITMDMGTETTTAQPQANIPGTYQTQVHFATSGAWQVRINILVPGQPNASTTFDITAQ